MAPIAPGVDHDVLEQQIKDTIQSLHNVMVQISAYDTATTPPATIGTPSSPFTRTSKEVLASELGLLSASLQTIHRTSTSPQTAPFLPQIPPELVQYVDNGRNPDIYTREFVELVRRANQLMRGKQNAFASFRDVLAAQIDKAMPELRDDAAKVVIETTFPLRPAAAAATPSTATTANQTAVTNTAFGGGGGAKAGGL